MVHADNSPVIDLNSDLGEGFGAYRMGDDSAMLGIVTSANIACGFHAGDPEIMANAFALAKAKGVTVGAHPSFPDLWGFGRRIMPFSAGEIERLIAYQIGAAQALSAYAGHRISYVKVHGALANLAQADADVANAICRAIKAVDASLVCLVIALGRQERAADELGLRWRSEIYADRAYTEDGFLAPRKMPGAVIHDVEAAASRAVRMAQSGSIETLGGKRIETPIHSICVHGDNPDAVAQAKAVRGALEQAGFRLRSFV
jgi:UPF0271 protein